MTAASAASAKKSTKKKAQGKKLVIVESPSKAKTIGKFLGSRYKVIASVGHVRDLPKSKLGVDVENDFEPQYINIRGKGDIIKELRSEAKKASYVFLATDPDREGEAISWHLAHILGIDSDEPCRIEFNEITKEAVRKAISSPRSIDRKLVDAQQARRVLDRLVGYQISPILWRKIRRGLSAGRVQSAALKIICDREKEIESFVPEEYWNITAYLQKDGEFAAKLSEYMGKKIKVESAAQADDIEKALKPSGYIVRSVTEKERMRKAYAPFTTSSLQQDAANKLNFSSKKTMKIAQELYEGIKIPKRGTVGLVSYIRTDSVRISDEARAAAKEFILSAYGSEYVGDNSYTNRKKEIQDAHEAIRPSYSDIVPDEIRDSLTNDQYKLYKLIWSRFIASQMKPARFMAMNVEIENGDFTFRATGSKLLFDGHLKVYNRSRKDDGDRLLPALSEGDRPQPVEDRLEKKKVDGIEKTEAIRNGIKKEQMFTQPPARFTEASLVKELEEKNIGRPSTYAPIVATLQGRKYIKKEKKSLIPTELGKDVTSMLSEYFAEIVDTGFTADMEDKLDTVEFQDVAWKKIIRDFYGDFEKELRYADETIESIEDKETGEVCEKCGRKMVYKNGRFGTFMACSGYPECRNTKPVPENGGKDEPLEYTVTDEICDKCGKHMVIRKGPYGDFLACSGYPECRNTKQVKKTTGVKCPECGREIVECRSRKGKVFYGCSGYPECSTMFWDRPVDRKCPECGSILVEKNVKEGTKVSCSKKGCGYSEPVVKREDD